MYREPMLREPMLREPMLREPMLREPMLREPMLREPVLREPELWKPTAPGQEAAQDAWASSVGLPWRPPSTTCTSMPALRNRNTAETLRRPVSQ